MKFLLKIHQKINHINMSLPQINKVVSFKIIQVNKLVAPQFFNITILACIYA